MVVAAGAIATKELWALDFRVVTQQIDRARWWDAATLSDEVFNAFRLQICLLARCQIVSRGAETIFVSLLFVSILVFIFDQFRITAGESVGTDGSPCEKRRSREQRADEQHVESMT